MYCAVYPGVLGFDKVVVGFDSYPVDVYGPDHETAIYAPLDSHDIAPKFVAYLTENQSRVIGYLTERISGRAATVDDLPACQVVLRRLHALGIAHGTLASDSFTIASDRVCLHGFGGSYRTKDSEVLAKEFDTLPEALHPVWNTLV